VQNNANKGMKPRHLDT